jgi:hypothetical protein
MKIEQKVIDRLNELTQRITALIENRHVSHGYEARDEYQDFLGYDPQYVEPVNTVNQQEAIQWKMSCINILTQVFGSESHYVSEFKHSTHNINSDDNYEYVKNSLAILKAAKDDCENGYIFNTRALIEAEVFDDFLERANELKKKGYYQAAAVITGCVLEDGLRKLCDRNSVTLPPKATIEPINVELAKAGVYNKLIQKKVTALADLRNKAAHGEWNEFNEKDVEDMIRDVRRFMEEHYS